ncbi:MAG: BspA family leucine-rich repeat surface protein [Balneolia bacterium]|nr:BspA family leucine-rich repeat surface protein [Balneolia bacterium]
MINSIQQIKILPLTNSLRVLTLGVILLSFITEIADAQDNGTFFIAENGVTVLCPDAEFGESGVVLINGDEVTFTKRTREDITAENAATTCTSGITDMSSLFNGQIDFNADISTWDTSNVFTMNSMFNGAHSFNQDISNWDVSGVFGMNFMFKNALAFNQDIGNWDTSTANTMWEMFYSAVEFNQDIGGWDVSSVSNMNGMFRFATVFSQNISNWCVTNIISMPPFFGSNSGLTFPQMPRWGTCPATSIPGDEELVTKISLAQNYPNPFNPSTVISFSLTEAADVRLDVYTLEGRNVASLIHSRQAQGEHIVHFDAAGLSSGVYIYRLQAGNQVLTKKMTLVR